MLSPATAETEIDRGIEADEFALYGERRSTPTSPFFRFPGFASNPALLDRMAGPPHCGVRRRCLGERLAADDARSQELHLILGPDRPAGRGIVLFHDTKTQTAPMLPAFLRELKRRGYHIVHVVRGSPPRKLKALICAARDGCRAITVAHYWLISR